MSGRPRWMAARSPAPPGRSGESRDASFATSRISHLGARGAVRTTTRTAARSGAGRESSRDTDAGRRRRLTAASRQSSLALRGFDLTGPSSEGAKMRCPRCQHENPSQAKFCLECGARFAHRCSHCGTELPPGAKFCPECGQAVAGPMAGQDRFSAPESYTPKHLAEKILTSKAAVAGERKQVTVLFADLKGSM